jgi:hypothetical protein
MAAELRMAAIGVLFFGSPTPRWMTGSPFSRKIRASSFNATVGEGWMEQAIWLKLMGNLLLWLFCS